MIVTLNGKPFDFTLERERTVGELLSGIETWLEQSRHSLSAFSIDGAEIAAAAVEEACARDLGEIERLDLTALSWTRLYRDALAVSLRTLEAAAAERDEARAAGRPSASAKIAAAFSGSPAENFLSGAAADLHRRVVGALAERSVDPSADYASRIAEIAELIAEIDDPRNALAGIRAAIGPLADRLEKIPLDLQTGKDVQAARVLQDLASVSEKLLRLIPILRESGLDFDQAKAGELPFRDYLEELSSALKELTAGYENGDAILVGDLAEYELAPRLRMLEGVFDSLEA